MSLDYLLKPISAASPCGEDTWLAEGRYTLQQPLEDCFASGSEPNWEELKETAVKNLESTRDLRAAVVLSLALLKTEQIGGFHDGISLICGLFKTFGEEVHPLPPNDSIRSNVISNLSPPPGSDTPYQFVKFLRNAPLCKSKAGTPYSLLDVENAEKDPSASALTLIESAFKATPLESVEATQKTLTGTLSQLQIMEERVNAAVGAVNGPDLKALKATLARMVSILAPYVPGVSNPAPGQPSASSPTAALAQGGAAAAMSGPVRSREDADRQLKEVMEYFKKHEPSSPVPYMIERVRRVARMDFVEAMRDLAPDAEGAVKTLFGIKDTPST